MRGVRTLAISKKIKRTGVTGGAQDPKIKLDLKDVFDEVPDRNLDLLVQSFGGALIDKIREKARNEDFLRQSRGAGVYSDEYAKSFEFKVFGKSKGNVNMTQSGFMLEDIDITDQDGSKMSIAFGAPINKKKAHGHITGNIGKVRDFFGVTDQELNQLKKEFLPQVTKSLDEERQANAPQELKRRVGESLIDFLSRIIRSGS